MEKSSRGDPTRRPWENTIVLFFQTSSVLFLFASYMYKSPSQTCVNHQIFLNCGSPFVELSNHVCDGTSSGTTNGAEWQRHEINDIHIFLDLRTSWNSFCCWISGCLSWLPFPDWMGFCSSCEPIPTPFPDRGEKEEKYRETMKRCFSSKHIPKAA